MQKKIIALAVAAAFSSPAFADVGFYGIVDAAVASISGSGQKSDLIATSGAASQSRLGVKATEDIGSGLTAVAVVEYGIDTQTVEKTSDTANNLIARQKMLAVAGSFGTVATGYLQTAAYDFLAKYDPIYGSGSSAHSIVAAGHLVGSGAQRAQRAVAYISPNISGMVFAANYATTLAGLGNLTVASGATTGLKSSAVILSANYAVDALSVGAVYAKTANDNTTGTAANIATTSEFAIGGSYDLGVAKLMGTYQSSKTSSSAKNDLVYSLAAVMPVSTGAFAVMYGANKNQEATAGSATAITGGYLHTFTKNTTGYVVVSSVKNGSATNGYSVSSNVLGGLGLGPATMTAGGSSSLIGVGLRKKF
jgi:predicted porin